MSSKYVQFSQKANLELYFEVVFIHKYEKVFVDQKNIKNLSRNIRKYVPLTFEQLQRGDVEIFHFLEFEKF